MAAYSELSRAGRSLGPYFVRTARTVLMVVAPIYIGLSLTAESAILSLFGEKWAEMIPIVHGLALAMPFFALHLICSPTTNAMGQPKVYLATSITGAFIMPALFLWGSANGAMGLVHAWWVAAPLLLTITLSLTLPRIGVKPLDLAKQLAPIALSCIVMAISVTLVQNLTHFDLPPLELAWNAVVGALTYIATLWFFWPRLVRETLDMLLNRQSAQP